VLNHDEIKKEEEISLIEKKGNAGWEKGERVSAQARRKGRTICSSKGEVSAGDGKEVCPIIKS